MAPIYSDMNILNWNASLVKVVCNETPGRRVWIARCDCRNLMLFELDYREQHKPEVLAFVRCDCCDHCKRPDQVLNLGNCRKKVTPHGRKRCLSVGFVVLGNGLPDCHQGEREGRWWWCTRRRSDHWSSLFGIVKLINATSLKTCSAVCRQTRTNRSVLQRSRAALTVILFS